MNSIESSGPGGSLASLRRFIRQRAPVERCELCSIELADEHQHLLEPQARKLICACDACSLLFSGQAQSKYKRVPRRIRYLRDFRMSDAQWDALLVPINMAFFSYSSSQQRVIALYPSPAGPTESLLPLDSWQDIARENPILNEMEPEVEALLVSRVDRSHGRSNAEYYLAPIDECFKLVGLIRAHWRGFSGGAEVWNQIADFFERLKRKAGSEATRA